MKRVQKTASVNTNESKIPDFIKYMSYMDVVLYIRTFLSPKKNYNKEAQEKSTKNLYQMLAVLTQRQAVRYDRINNGKHDFTDELFDNIYLRDNGFMFDNNVVQSLIDTVNYAIEHREYTPQFNRNLSRDYVKAMKSELLPSPK